MLERILPLNFATWMKGEGAWLFTEVYFDFEPLLSLPGLISAHRPLLSGDYRPGERHSGPETGIVTNAHITDNPLVKRPRA